MFIVGNRRFYGGWGGVGGWYVWDWAPWILVAFDDVMTVSEPAGRILIAAAAAFVVVANVVYFDYAIRLYA